ncbi:DUF4412 domain-containing protein [bacterium]|nr:DUF4412 domain-containing protein [candidate division CSSED10-310 bacterium]
MKQFYRIAILLTVALSMTSLVSADFYYETEITGQPGTTGPTLAKNYISENGMRMETGDGTAMIIDFKKEMMINLDTKKKQYSEVKFEEMMQPMENDDAKMLEQMTKMVDQMLASMQVTPIDETKEINGWNCKKYNVTIMGSTMEYWVTKDIKNYRELEQYIEKYKKVFEKNPLLKNISTGFEMQKKIDGFPIRTINKMMGMEIISTVTKIEDKKIDESIYSVPEGFTKTVEAK